MKDFERPGPLPEVQAHSDLQNPQAEKPEKKIVDPQPLVLPERMAAEPEPPAKPSVLDHLRRGALGDAFAQSTEGPGQDLPGLADLEREFKDSLSAVRVYTGSGPRTMLDYLGAEAAAGGNKILLRDRGVSRDTVAHEVAHTLQSSGDAAITKVVDHDDPAEDEAEQAEMAAHRGVVHHRIPLGGLALRRVRQRNNNAATADGPAGIDLLDAVLPPVEGEDDDAEAEPGLQERQDAADEATETSATAEPETADSEAEESEPPAAAETAADEATTASGEAEAGAIQAEDSTDPDEAEQAAPDEVAESPEAAAQAAAAGPGVAEDAAPDRQAELRAEVDEHQDRWDAGSSEAEDHQVSECPANANPAGSLPFARGPPIDIPATDDAQIPENPDPGAVATGPLDRARTGIDTQLSAAPARAPPTSAENLGEEERAELRRIHRAADRSIADAVEEQDQATIDDESLTLDGQADPERITTKQRSSTEKAARNLASAETATEESFGDESMAPAVDPTEDLNTELDGLEPPEVDIESMIESANLDRIATTDNAGTVPIDDVVVITDEFAAAHQERTQAQHRARQTIHAEIGDSETLVAQRCQEAKVEHERAETDIGRGVTDRRGDWEEAVQTHATEKTGDAEQLIESKRSHITTIEEDANRDAGEVITEARTTAETQRTEAEERAKNKATETEDSSWFSRGIEWLQSALADLVSWIDEFIEHCHTAIDLFLDRAAEVAHGIIEAGRAAITATIDGLHTGLDLIVDNLPGEFGEIARGYRDDIHEFLDQAQAGVDAWAEALHNDVDEHIEGLRQTLHGALDDFQQGVHDVAEALDEILENGLMPWLRATFPQLAALIDNGLLTPIREASDTLSSWLESALEATGFRDIQRELETINIETICEPLNEEEQAQDCEGFKLRLESTMETVDALMASPLAERMQAFLTESRDEAAAEQVDAANDFFDFIHLVSETVYGWWQEIQPTIQSALDTLGEIGSTIWRHIAEALGLDVNLPPLEAIKDGLRRLWQSITDAVAPIIQAITDGWNWLMNSPLLAPVFAFFRAVGELGRALGDLWDRIVSGTEAWLAEAADVLSNTILPFVQGVIDSIADVVTTIINQVESWCDGILEAIASLIDWQAVNAFVEALSAVLSALVAPVRIAIQLFKSCGLRIFRWLADALRNIGSFVRMLLDVAVGIVLALLTMPIGLVAFLAGNVWLHVLPDCYKAPILNFLIDLAIRFVRFLPEPADFMWAVVYAGLLGFLQGLREAPDQQKVGAVNLFASIFAGNAELAAGFLVGLVEGVWESTGGTIIFLLKAVAWIIMLPVKLAAWGINMVRGAFAEGGDSQRQPGGAQARAPPGRRTDAAGDDVDNQVDNEVRTDDDAERTAGNRRRRTVTTRPRAPRAGGSSRTRIVSRVVRTVAGDDDTEDPSDGADSETEARDGTNGETADEVRTPLLLSSSPLAVEQRVRRASDRSGPSSTEDEPGADSELVARDAQLDQEIGGDSFNLDGEDVGPPDQDRVAEGPADDQATEDQPPAAPEGLSTLSDSLRQLVTDGFSRRDVMQLIDGARSAMRGMIGNLARDAAASMLAGMNAEGAAFAIGRTIGRIVGMVVTEVLLAVFTGGGSTMVTAAKAALTGARMTARFASVIAKIKGALQPLLGIVQRLRGALGNVLRSIRRWFDDVLRWMRGVTRRAQRGVARRLGRGGRPRAPRPARPGAPRGGGRRGRGGRRRDRGDAQARRRRQQRRLRRVMRALRPRVRRVVRDGVGKRRLRMWLRVWSIRYRARLRLLPSGTITIRVNPTDTLPLAKIDPGELGRILRPVLARAQREYEAVARDDREGFARFERRARGRDDANTRDLPARAAINIQRPGELLTRRQRQALLAGDRPLSRVDAVQDFLRGRRRHADSGVLIPRVSPSPGQLRPRRRFRLDGVSFRQRARRGLPASFLRPDLGGTVIAMGGRLGIAGQRISPMNDEGLRQILRVLPGETGLTDSVLTEMVSSPVGRREDLIAAHRSRIQGAQNRRRWDTHSRLLRRLAFRDDLEAARNPGIGSANAVARLLGREGHLSMEEQFGRETGYSPGSREGVTSSDLSTRQEAMALAEGDIGRIFQRLEATVRRADLIKGRDGFIQRDLVRTVRNFLSARKGDFRHIEDRRALERARLALEARLIRLLEMYD